MNTIYTKLFESKDMKVIRKIGSALLITTIILYLLLIIELWKA